MWAVLARFTYHPQKKLELHKSSQLHDSDRDIAVYVNFL